MEDSQHNFSDAIILNDDVGNTVNETVDDEHNSDKDRTEKEIPVGSASSMEIDGWDYDDAHHAGDNVAAASFSIAGPSTVTAQVGLTTTTSRPSEAQATVTVGTMNRESTLVIEDPIISNLLESSQHSFCDLNISFYEDPYSTNIDFGVDF